MAKILVIDDDEAIFLLLKAHLQQIGHVVIWAAAVRQGLQKLALSDVDLIITDIFMPEKDGYEFMQEFFHHPPLGVDPKKVPVIAMTGHDIIMGNDLILRIARRFGASETLQKPFTSTEVMEKVAQLIGGVAGHNQQKNQFSCTHGR